MTGIHNLRTMTDTDNTHPLPEWKAERANGSVPNEETRMAMLDAEK
jgi:hypothetical protein